MKNSYFLPFGLHWLLVLNLTNFENDFQIEQCRHNYNSIQDHFRTLFDPLNTNTNSRSMKSFCHLRSPIITMLVRLSDINRQQTW